MNEVNSFVKLYNYIIDLTSIDELLNSKFKHIESSIISLFISSSSKSNRFSIFEYLPSSHS